MTDLFDDISLSPRGAEPVYVRLAAAIRSQILHGALARGQRLPTVRTAARTLGLNANTVQRAYNLLAQEGALTSRRGAGTQVAPSARARTTGDSSQPSSWLSARNQIVGTVQSVEIAGVMAEVVLMLPGGQEVVAAITRASAEKLGLATGSRAMAVIKSTDVMLALASSDTSQDLSTP